MARYVLVEVDNLATAERLRTQIDKAHESGKGMRVAGLFAAPTSWCSCPKTQYRDDIVRGSKLGWWVHRVCRRARPGTHNLANLISPTDRPYGVETGRVQVVHSVTIGEVPIQNLR